MKLVKEWNPALYNTNAVINAVLEHLLISDTDKSIYLEALAMLYSYEKKYDKSLAMYLKYCIVVSLYLPKVVTVRFVRLKHKDVFNLIQKYNLYNVIHDMIIELMDLDHEKTIGLLLEKETIASEIVVEKLKNHELLLYRVNWRVLFRIWFRKESYCSTWMLMTKKILKVSTMESWWSCTRYSLGRNCYRSFEDLTIIPYKKL